MIRKNNLCPAILALLFAVSCTNSVPENYWPQFRGPENNMVTKGGNLPETWRGNQNIRWTFDMTGESWSSPIISGDKLFITSAFQENKSNAASGPMGPPPPQNQANPRENGQAPPPPSRDDDKSYLNDIYRWELTCISLKTGKELWKQVVFKGSPKIKKHPVSTYACETPVTDGKRIYAYFGAVGLFCYNFDGTLLWKKEPGAYNTQRGWGTGSSPAISNGILYILNDNEENSYLTAFDATTGDEIWRVARDEKTTYSTPVVWKNKTRTELVTLGKTARSYDPQTGKLFWELKIGGEQAIPAPVYDNECIYLGNAGGREVSGTLFCVKAGAGGDITPADSGLVSNGVKWAVRDAGLASPSPVLYDGLIYILAGRGGELNCFEAATGNRVYRQKTDKTGSCWASPWIHNGKLYFYDEKGVTQAVKTGKKFEAVASNSIDDKFWASVAIAGDAYVFKGVKKLYCVSGVE